VRLFGDSDSSGPIIGPSVVGGVRTSFYAKEVPSEVQSVGVTFHPAAARALVGYTADELAGRHVSLEQLWSASVAAELRERLHAVPTPGAQLDLLEGMLAERLRGLRGIHPAVAVALERFRLTTNVAAVVRDTGYSHRTLAEQFRRTMGIGPKAYLRMARMRRLLKRIGHAPWSDLAAEAGFSDQAHFVREFRQFTGATPTGYLGARPGDSYHFRILQDTPATSR
jgi:AraC-like DNA-binding protein